MKALYRKAKAMLGLNEIPSAIAVLEQCLAINNADELVNGLYQTCLNKHMIVNRNGKLSYKAMFDVTRNEKEIKREVIREKNRKKER